MFRLPNLAVTMLYITQSSNAILITIICNRKFQALKYAILVKYNITYRSSAAQIRLIKCVTCIAETRSCLWTATNIRCAEGSFVAFYCDIRANREWVTFKLSTFVKPKSINSRTKNRKYVTVTPAFIPSDIFRGSKLQIYIEIKTPNASPGSKHSQESALWGGGIF
jgi:hypothetical protein